jgi:chromosome partition protein MukF
MALDSARLIASLHRENIGLDLKTVDLCFLVALFARARQGALSSFDEEAVVETFEQICELIEPGANPNIRATHSIQRLRDQRLLARVDGAGLVRAGEYTLILLCYKLLSRLEFHDESIYPVQIVSIHLTGWRRRAGRTSWSEAQSSARGRWLLLIIAAIGCCARIGWVGIERSNPGCCVTNTAETASADWRRQVRRLIGAAWR